MTEILVRTSLAPAAIAIVEVEAPSRLFVTCSSDADERALRRWIDVDPLRQALIASALAAEALGGGFEHGRAWARALRREQQGGVQWLAEQLVETQRRVRELEAAADRRPAR